MLTVLEGIRIYTGKAKAEIAASGAMYSLMADYNREIFKRYHLLVLDVDYGGRGEAFLEERVDSYLDYTLNNDFKTGFYEFSVKDVSLVDNVSILDEDMAFFKKQINDYIITYGIKDITKEIIDRLSDIESDKEVDGDSEGINYDDQEDINNPLDTIKLMLKNGILAYVLPNEEVPSEEEVDIKKLPLYNKSEYDDEKYRINSSFEGLSQINEVTDATNIKNIMGNIGVNDLNAILYAMNCFAYCGSPYDEETKLKYEVEYLIAGKKSDYKNIESISNRITFIRFGIRYSKNITSAEKKAVAEVVATGLSIATCTEGAVEIYSQVILAAWSYIDALNDTKDLFHGDEVDKLYYQDYLAILLAMKVDKESIYYRMLDLIELNICQYEEDFNIDNCSVAVDVSGSLEFNKLFNLFGRDLSYTYYFDKVQGY